MYRSLMMSAWRHKGLIFKLTYREIAARYRGSMAGVAWSFFNPVLMLAVYTFVFSMVFKAKWGGESSSQGEFAVILFAGMIIFNIFAECISRAPMLMVENSNYVKKVVFPLEVLPWVVLGNALFHALISFFILLLAQLVVFNSIPLSILLLPFIMLPFVLFIVGGIWFLSAIGVYVRDLSQFVGVAITVLMFTSPLFFPLEALPEFLQPYLALNPLAYFITGVRDVVIFGNVPDLVSYVIVCGLSFFIFSLGLVFFGVTKKGFADVL
ncbi:ABC transporter permease [Marinomonas communis]|uniref:Transport permease protein n=1 Tax=Marinomonas communis TaxID=28254 RepID=A0A4V3DG92_9GAMM|nr:ABC transporter permease [Marinomonas communis]TDR13101.1 lipopolysaccharide transport system permease protein [Marinomonas communis]